jgi:hypothetical protein
MHAGHLFASSISFTTHGLPHRSAGSLRTRPLQIVIVVGVCHRIDRGRCGRAASGFLQRRRQREATIQRTNKRRDGRPAQLRYLLLAPSLGHPSLFLFHHHDDEDGGRVVIRRALALLLLWVFPTTASSLFSSSAAFRTDFWSSLCVFHSKPNRGASPTDRPRSARRRHGHD